MSPALDLAPDLPPPSPLRQDTVGAGDLRARARRLALPAAAIVAIVVVAVVAGGPARTFAHAIGRAFSADPVWVVAGFAFELASFGGYVLLLWLIGGRAAPRIGVRESAQITLAGAAATRLLPTAGAGGVAVTLWGLQRAGRGERGAATRTLLAFLVVLYSVFVVSVLVAGTLLATGVVGARHDPLALTALPAAAAAVVLAGALAVALAAPRTAGRAGRLARIARAAGTAVRDAVRTVRGGDPRLLGAVAWWGFDVAVLWAAFHALGTPPPFGVLVLAYFVGQLCNLVPLPGTVSGGLVGVLLAFGVSAELALAAVLTYRAIAVWTPAPLGAAAVAGLRRTVARWSAEDERAGERATVAGRRPTWLHAPRRRRGACAPSTPRVLAA